MTSCIGNDQSEEENDLQDDIGIYVVDVREKNFKCDLCGKSYTKAVGLYQHKRRIHKYRIFPCDVCKKCFESEEAVDAHKVVHASTTLYKCNICSKLFGTQQCLTLHLQRHSNDFECTDCNEKFQKQYKLVKHCKVHKPLKCEVCNESYRKMAHLTEHVKSHLSKGAIKARTKADPEIEDLTCPLCGIKLLSKVELKSHVRWHTSKKPYECQGCRKRFMKSSYLKDHRKSHCKFGSEGTCKASAPKVRLLNSRSMDRAINIDHQLSQIIHVPSTRNIRTIKYPGICTLKCMYCQYATTVLKEMVRHLAYHTIRNHASSNNKKYHQCEKCDFISLKKVYLREHRKTYH